MNPIVSVIIPCRNSETTIGKTLRALANQTFRDFEVIVVDDASSDKSAEVAKSFGAKLVSLKECKGPAFARNRGVEVSSGEFLLFTDADCQPGAKWVENVVFALGKESPVLMGRVSVPKTNFFADSIAELGFPAGANAGFENMWPVSKEGFTNHLSSCNLAITRVLLEEAGRFNESFPYAGGEDTFLAFTLSKKGIKIKYLPKMSVVHEPTASWRKFLKWQFVRGKANYHFKKKVGHVRKFVALRLWSSKNILRKNLFTRYFPAVFSLLSLSFFLQQAGYFWEWSKNIRR